MFSKPVLKYIACVVITAYLSMFGAQSIGASEWQLTINPQIFAQTEKERTLIIGTEGEDKEKIPTNASMTTEDRKARESVFSGKIQRFEEDINKEKGIRKNLLTVAVAAFSIGATLAFGINMINGAIDDISVENPEDQPTEVCIEERYGECCEYVSYTEEKQDAQDSLDGIKGIGGGIFIVGAVSVLGYLFYTRSIRQKQQNIETIQSESEGIFEPTGLTPEYLRRNESVAAVFEEIDELKKKAGSSRTKGEIFSRLALGSLASGVFLVGLSNVSHTIVGNITIDESDPADVAAKDDALDKTDELKAAGVVLIGTGAAAGVTSFVFGRLAARNENQIDDLEDSLWRTVERIDIQPTSNGFMVVYTHPF